MGAANVIGANFEKISHMYARSETGGLLNYIFEPVHNQTTGEVLLKLAELTLEYLVDSLKTIIFKPKPSVRVLEVLPSEVQPNHIDDNAYGVAVALAVAAILFALISLIALVVISMIYCCCFPGKGRGKRKQQDGSAHLSKGYSICYICLSILTIVMLVFLILCAIVGFVAVASLVSGVSSKDQEQEIPQGLAAATETVVLQLRLFLNEFIEHGRNATTLVVNNLVAEVKVDLASLVRNILDDLLDSYGVKNLLGTIGSLGSDIDSLQEIATSVVNLQEIVITNITTFQGTMMAYRNILNTSLHSLCGNIFASECSEFMSQLATLSVDFDVSRINSEPSIALSNLVSVFGTNISEVANQFDNLQVEINSKAESLIEQVQGAVNFDEQFESLLSIWETLNSKVAEPTISQLDDVQPTVNKVVELAALVSALVGYVCMAVISIVLLVMIIYIVVCAVEASQRGLISFRSNKETGGAKDNVASQSYNGSKHKISCGSAAVAVLGIFIFLIVILSTVFTAVLIVTNDEACRYVSKQSAIRITDSALDLFIKYQWPMLITDDVISPEVRALLQLRPPSDILNALLNKCQPTTETEIVPLLPNLGIRNLVNVTAVLEQPSLKEAISQSESKVVEEVLKVDFTQYIPQSVDELLKTVQNLTGYLDQSNYTDTIDQLNTSIIDVPTVTAYLEQLSEFVGPYTNNNSDAQTIQNTADSCLATLSGVGDLTNTAMQLASYFERLQQYQSITPQLENIGVSIQDIVTIFRNSTAVAEPIGPIFQRSINQLLAALNISMNNEMSQFTSQVVSCSRLHLIVKSTLEITCGTTGLLNRLGGFTFILALLSCPLLFTAIIFLLLLGLHERHCLYADG